MIQCVYLWLILCSGFMFYMMGVFIRTTIETRKWGDFYMIFVCAAGGFIILSGGENILHLLA